MVLGHSEISKLIKSDNLITNLAERELKNPEGCVLDLRLDKIFRIEGTAFLGIDERETPNTIEVAVFEADKPSIFTFKPGDFFLVKTIESVNLPNNVAAIFKPRSTTFRSELNIRTGIANPGYCGPLYFGLKNEGPVEVKIELGARFVSIIFLEVKGAAVNTYRGQWQGGRATTQGREKQI